MLLEMWPKDNMYQKLFGALFKIQSPELPPRVKEPDFLQMDGAMESAFQLSLVIVIHTKEASHNLRASTNLR